jgi:hypothetical protein
MNRFSVNPKFIWLLFISFVLMSGWIVFMRYELTPFNSAEIVRFEFAGSQETVETILAEWQQKDWIGLAKHSVYLDFIFLFLYGATLALGCLTFPSFSNKPGLMSWGMRCYRFSLYAALADFLENLCLLEMLYGSEHTFFPAAAWLFAFVKFGLVLGVLIFLVLCLMQAVIGWVMSKL